MINFIFLKFDKKNLLKTSKFILIICIIIFSGKQFQRYSNNLGSDYIWPRIYSYGLNEKVKSTENYFGNNLIIYQVDGLCMYSSSPCSTYKLKENLFVKKVFNYKIVGLKR